jgi:phosphate transport system permease protein
MSETVEALWQDDFSYRRKRIQARLLRRRWIDRVIKVLTVLAVIALLYPLIDMILMFAYKGATLISTTIFTQVTALNSATVTGGLQNAISGTLLLIALSSAISVPLGVMGGIYLAEFSPRGRLSGLIRFVADILAAVPSIVLGYAGLLFLVLYLGWGFSALAGALTLSVFMFPYILRTTELSLKNVPQSYREAAMALGSSKTNMISRVTLRAALPGISTGIILSTSIASGETAQLLYTAGYSGFNPTALLHSPVGYLTYVVYVFSQLSFPTSQNLALVASFLLLAFVISLNVAARLLVRRMAKG